MSEMIWRVVEAYVDAKMQRADISVALYKVAPDVGGPALVKRTGQRLRKAIESMLLTAPEEAIARQTRHRHNSLSNVGSDAVRSRGWRLASNVSQDERASRAALPILYGGCGSERLRITCLEYEGRHLGQRCRVRRSAGTCADE